MTSPLSTVPTVPEPMAARLPADPQSLLHRELLGGEFWRRIPAYAEVEEKQFLEHHWQAKNSITRVPQLLQALSGLVSSDFIKDVEAGFQHSPMAVRVSPYLLSLIDWTRPNRAVQK